MWTQTIAEVNLPRVKRRHNRVGRSHLEQVHALPLAANLINQFAASEPRDRPRRAARLYLARNTHAEVAKLGP